MAANEKERNSQIALARKKVLRYASHMSDALSPQIVRARAVATHTSMYQLLKRAKVSSATFWRWERGDTDKPNPVTLRKISDVLDAIEKEREA